MRNLMKLFAIGSMLALSINSAFAQSEQEKPEESKPELVQLFNSDEQGPPKSESTD